MKTTIVHAVEKAVTLLGREREGAPRPCPGALPDYFLGVRCKMTTSSVPEPGPLLVPDG
jgi:hypothetical protein